MDNKDLNKDRKPVTYTTVDWDKYRIKKEGRDRNEEPAPASDEKWAIDTKVDERHAYDFASDEEFNKALKEADSKDKKKKKSLGKKLDELGSTWVSTGNFRNREDLDDNSLKDLEKNIIKTTKGSTDEFLSKAVTEVSEALRDENGYEPLGEVSLADTFEIPKLDIHFGDTQDLKNVKDDLKELKDEDLKKQIEKLDLAASIEAQTDKEIKEKEAADEVDKIIVKSDELKKKKKKSKPSAEENAGAGEVKEAKKKRSSGTKEKEKVDREAFENDEIKEVRKKKSSKAKEKVPADITGEEAGEIKVTRKKSSRIREGTEDKKAAAGNKKTRTGKKTEEKAAAPENVKKRRSPKKAEEKTARKTRADKKAAAAEAVKTRADKKPAGLNRDKKAGGPSEFRKQSADWKDKKVIDKTAKTVTFEQRRKEFAERLKKVTPIQWSIAAMALIIFVTGIMTTAAYANYQGEENKAIALKNLSRYKEDDSYMAMATEVTEEMIPEAAEEPEPEVAKALSLEMSSVEKDLKIKLVDEDDTLVKDVSWSVTVSEDKGDDSESSDGGEVYEDEDMDGTIYIESIAAGDYSVVLNPSDSLADYLLPQEKQLVSVKAAIEYKVIANIKDEIKSEKEVNVALEDPNGNQAADVEVAAPANIDTVEWFESTKEANGEEYVEATPDISKTAASVKKNNGILTALSKIVKGTGISLSKTSTLGFNMPVGRLVATTDDITVQEGENTVQSEDQVEPEPTPTPTPEPQDVLGEPQDNPTPVQEEASLSISGNGSLTVGSNVTITAVYKPDNSSVSWNISDSSIATISDNGSTCQVTGVKAGEVTLTATCNNGKETTMRITVTDKPAEYSDDAKLYDASKNALYVRENDEYRLATYGDYRSGNFSTYYRKQESYLYTGWQDIDGHTYYYKGDHTYVTGEQIIQGIRYNFASDGTLSKGSGTLGIDVSKYQPNINWNAVKASGVNYVIIRCGYRGASTGVLIQDPYFTSHIKGAKAAGLKVGVYFFTTALNETEAIEEASMCAALCSGYGINYPVFMDCESSSRPGYNELSSSERTAIIKAFCNTIKSAGYTPGVYANKTWLSSKMNVSSLSGAKIWLAQYNPAGPTYSGRYDIWQYTSKGHVDGISGNVDMNQSYLGY